MKTVLILGSTGMLGSIVDLYFRTKAQYKVISTHRGEDRGNENLFHFDAEDNSGSLAELFKNYPHIEYVINCIGIIKPHCKDDDRSGVLRAIRVNALFPHILEDISHDHGAKVLQIATDCVYSGSLGNYTEDHPHDALDVYGKTKSLGELKKGNGLNLRCSIIGPEKKGKLSLLEWVLNLPDGEKVKGFSHHKWNGVTTLQFSEMCNEIIEKSLFEELVGKSRTYHCVVNRVVTKYELVKAIAETFGKALVVEKVDSVGNPIDRSLSSKYAWRFSGGTNSISEALQALKKFMTESGYTHA